MNIQYSPDHIQSALNHLHNNFEDFKSEILNLSPDFAVDTETINIRQHIGANDNDKVIASIKELASNLIKSIQIYLHRIGVTKEILMVGQVNANMKNSGKSGLKGGKVYIIPLEMVENYTVKKWFSIIENEISETLNLAYEFSNIRTDITENNLPILKSGQTYSKKAIDDFMTELKAKDKELEEKDKQLEAKDRELEAKDKQLEAKDRELDAKDRELESLIESLRSECYAAIEAARCLCSSGISGS